MSDPRPRDPNELSEIVEQMVAELREAAERVVPRFLATMPPGYFRGTDHATRVSHVKAILATETTGISPELILRDGSRHTFIRERSYPGQLAELLEQLPSDQPLRAARVHTSTDGRLVLDVFEFGQPTPFDPDAPDQVARARAVLAHAREHQPGLPAAALEEHLRRCAGEYLLKVPPQRICRHFRLFRALRGSEDTSVEIETLPGTTLSQVVVGVGNAIQREMFKRIALVLGRYDIDIQAAHLDSFEEPDGSAVSLLSFLVEWKRDDADGDDAESRAAGWEHVRQDLMRLKWVDEAALRLATRLDGDLARAEVLQGLCHLAHQVLTKRNPLAFTRVHILECAEQHLTLATQVTQLFLQRFDPTAPLDAEAFRARAAALEKTLAEEVDGETERQVFSTLLDVVAAITRTNIQLDSRYALALEVDPALLATAERDELPYAVFFVHGRDFNGFHVRFREIARGGVRLVHPRGREQFFRETERLYDEVYGLALAQQLKNKDIPEGGAKGVVLIAPLGRPELCAKAFASGLLDLVIPDLRLEPAPPGQEARDERLYLGPDENVSNALIDWIVEHAASRGYPAPHAFMSSKPGAGINHKAYGVTSEGVTVFLEVALRSLGIDPRETPFTLKMTGGPDGDVAGNEIRILAREYGANARILGISDGSGCAEDPAGLDHGELLRLVAGALPIAHFDPERLSSGGRVVALSDPNGLRLRNSLHNRIVADAFVPAGGRPRTVHEGNWREYLTPTNEPSSRVIVEGANLFLTPEARTELSRRGVLIVKDSSANKCGAICSSFEILASMLLSEQEFLAIKEPFVAEVIGRLRQLARLEAELLMRERRHRPGVPLPELSTRLSRTLIASRDAIVRTVQRLEAEDPALAQQLMERYVPPALREAAGERLAERLPRGYVRHAIATVLAGLIVYREGPSYLEGAPPEVVAEIALRYLRQERETQALASQVEASDLPDRARIASLLREGATSVALRDPTASP